jgi:hypothetical protein
MRIFPLKGVVILLTTLGGYDMLARASRRSATGPNRGSINPKLVITDYQPYNPKINDIWYDTATPAIKYWTGVQWFTFVSGNGGDITLNDITCATLVASGDISTLASVTAGTTVSANYMQSSTGKFGDVDGGHYIEFESDGTLKMNGNATTWEDLVMPLTTGKQGALSRPDFDYDNVGYLFPQNDNSEKLYLVMQIPHSYKQETTIYPHLHWLQTTSSNVTWKLDYKWTNIGATVTDNFTTIEMTRTVCTYSSGTLHQISETLNGIDGTGKTISSILAVKLYRDDNIYTGDALAYQFDIHYESDTLGSRQEFVK